MSDVRLLDEGEEDDFMAFGQSDLTSVLANPDFGRRRCTRILAHCRKFSCSMPSWSDCFRCNALCLQALGQTPQLLAGAATSPFQRSSCRCGSSTLSLSSRIPTGCSTEYILAGPAGCALLAMLFLILFLVSALSSTGLKTDTGLSTDTDASNISGTATVSTILNGE